MSHPNSSLLPRVTLGRGRAGTGPRLSWSCFVTASLGDRSHHTPERLRRGTGVTK